MKTSNDFLDYELIDMANKTKLERWKDVYLERPDPQIIWSKKEDESSWKLTDAKYMRSSTGGGHWEIKNKIKDVWQVKCGELVFNVKPMGFKHTGVFPEQAVNWRHIIDKINKESKDKKEKINVLNLFAYTGGATLAAASAHAKVCHVDSSKGMVEWAKENAKSSKVDKEEIRYIIDDVKKFVTREIKRNSKYDIIILDPPSYGRGTSKEVWSIEKDLEELLKLCVKVLSDNPIMIMINTYTGGLSGETISTLLTKCIEEENEKLLFIGEVSHYDIGLKTKSGRYILPCGITTKWEKN